MCNKQVKINDALDSVRDIRCVNDLVQGLCARLNIAELSYHEGMGLAVVMEWQNQKLLKLESLMTSEMLSLAGEVEANDNSNIG